MDYWRIHSDAVRPLRLAALPIAKLGAVAIDGVRRRQSIDESACAS